MRVLITSFTYLPNKDGVAEATRLMAEGLAKLDWEVTVGTTLFGGSTDTGEVEVCHGVSIHRFDVEKPYPAESEIARYRDFIRDENFDVIVNHCCEVGPSRYMADLFPALGVPKVLVSHGFPLHIYVPARGRALGVGKWLRGVRWTILNLVNVLRRYDAVIFLSEKKGWGRFLDHQVATWIQHPRIEVVPNGTEPGSFSTAGGGFRERHGIGPGPLVLCVANYCDRKDQKLALELFRKADVPGSTLVFIGSELNAYAEAAEVLDVKLAAAHPSCNVLFLEKLERSEIFSAFNAMDLFLLAAKAETQPIVLIEAMAAGKPWISTDTGCVDRMEGGVTCRSNREIIRALGKLLRDPEARAALGEKGREAVRKHYRASECVKRYDSIFKSLIATRVR